MSAPRRRSAPARRRSGRAIEIWLIALLVALVATVQIRSQAEVEKSFVGTDTTTLAFLLAGLQALDLQDAVNNLAAAGAEAISVNDHRVTIGVLIQQTPSGVTIDGALVLPPWTILVIGDANRLAATAELMTQQMRGDRRVRQATYRVESDVEIRAVITQRPFVYANGA